MSNQKPEPQKHIDPVCGMEVLETPEAHKHDYKGKTYYFCAPGCKHSFAKEPEKYLDPNYKPSM